MAPCARIVCISADNAEMRTVQPFQPIAQWLKLPAPTSSLGSISLKDGGAVVVISASHTCMQNRQQEVSGSTVIKLSRRLPRHRVTYALLPCLACPPGRSSAAGPAHLRGSGSTSAPTLGPCRPQAAARLAAPLQSLPWRRRPTSGAVPPRPSHPAGPMRGSARPARSAAFPLR